MKEKITFAGFEVVVDTANLKFDEMTLSDYIQKESAYYDNFGGYLALAERSLHAKEVVLEKLYHERFVEAKEMGGSDKLAEAKSKSDPDVNKLKSDIVEAKYVVARLKQHLRAWDKNHDNAQSLGHNLRKQMDKLHGDIMMQSRSISGPGLDNAIEETVKPKSDDKPTGFADDLGIAGLV